MSDRDYGYDATKTPFEPRAALFNANNALCLAAAANLAYEESPMPESVVSQWGFEKYRFIGAKGTQGFVCGNAKLLLIVFRGTEPEKLKDWLTNIMIEPVAGPAGEIHKGFWGAVTGVWPQIQQALTEYRTNHQPIWVGGHSLGGALALLTAARLQLQEQTLVQGVYTFGQPRAGNYSFAKAFDRVLEGRAIRFVNNNDVVPHVPLSGPVQRYWHTKGLIYIDADGNLKPDIPYLKRLRDSLRGAAQDLGKLGPDALKDHSMDNYVRHIRQSIK
ncbi:MAG: lipase family protein [Gammaproteobacteria bacterium]